MTAAAPATQRQTQAGVVVPALYDAVVTHARTAPVGNRFRYRTAYWLVDADAPPRLRGLARLWSTFDPADHIDIRAFLAERSLTPARILMLTNAKVLGYVFNPITVYWCYDAAGDLLAHVAEVHNTYGGRHAYLLHPDADGVSEAAKELYVSPFYPVDGRYRIRIGDPGDTVAVSVTLHRPHDKPFVATLTGRRRPLTLAALLRMSLRYPWNPLRVSVLIRWQGIRLWRRGLEVHPR